jgi:hypothetical protein
VVRFVWVEEDGSSSMIMMARMVWALGFCPSHWMRSCEASAYGIAFDGYVIMFEHSYGSLAILLTKSIKIMLLLFGFVGGELGNNFWRYIGHNFLRDLPDRFMGFGIFF